MADKARDIGVLDFSGKREDAKGFLNDLDIHFLLNAKSFPDNTSKVLYMLGKLNGGTAKAWKDLKIKELSTTNPPYDITIVEFVKQFKEYFLNIPGASTPLEELMHFRWEEGVLCDDFITNFKAKALDTGDPNHALLSLIYIQALPERLIVEIMKGQTQPKDMEEWYASIRNAVRRMGFYQGIASLAKKG